MKGYLVVIEWDGEKPSNAFYHRVRKLAGRVRGDKSTTPFARRSINTAIIMQEGAIYCSDESLARTIALLAQKFEATSVTVGQVFGMKPVVAQDSDLEALHRVERICGRRGRPPENEPTDWHVVCYMEGEVLSERDKSHEPLNCPECGTMLIKSYPYRETAEIGVDFHEKANRTIFGQWLAARFKIKGNYFPQYYSSLTLNKIVKAKDNPLTGANEEDSFLSGVGPLAQDSLDIIWAMNGSDFGFLDALLVNHTGISTSMAILDGIFVGQYKMSEEAINKSRIAAIAQVIQDHGAHNFHLVRPDDMFDLFDAAAVKGIEFVSKAFGKIKEEPEILKASSLLLP